MKKPNILFIMCDQLRADAIAAMGNSIVRTPNLDRLANRGISFMKAYSTCPVCIPARYTIRTGCEPFNTGVYENGRPVLLEGQSPKMEDRCGDFLARTLSGLGYRTFGIGKFHTLPWGEDIGFETIYYSEELFDTPEQRQGDAYASFIAREHPEFDFIEQLHGERTEMYYMPQMSPLPAGLTVESWAADRAVENIQKDDGRPYFGFVSFIGPHPPFTPPIPFNRMYCPDNMPDPVEGDIAVDHMDEQIPWMNKSIWAENINHPHARVLKSRYYGEISYIDGCIGRILDAVEAGSDPDNTLICFFSDHGDHLGDHHAWQKESFFDSSCRVPMLVSWPAKLSVNVRWMELICLTDLFGIATKAAGKCETRDGMDVLGMLEGRVKAREFLFGYHGIPGTSRFKIMVREKDWKYIFMANGEREQLFNVTEDPDELVQRTFDSPLVLERLRKVAVMEIKKHKALADALDNNDLRAFGFQQRPNCRIRQFDRSRGVKDFTV